MRRSPEVLLSVRIVALGPLVFLVNYGAKACLVRVNHKLFKAHLLLVSFQIL